MLNPDVGRSTTPSKSQRALQKAYRLPGSAGSADSNLDRDSVLDGAHVRGVSSPMCSFEPPFAYRRDPVFHRFALMSIDGHVGYLRAGVPGLKSTSASGARRLAQDLASALEDRIQHRYRQAPREGVLLTRVIGGDQTHVPEV
jgi:hypothetical protein